MDIAAALEQLKTSSDYQTLIEAIAYISSEGKADEQSITRFVELIKSSDRGVKDAAARAISDLRGDDATFAAKLISAYILDSNIEVRNLAGDILIKMGAPAAEHLLEYLSHHDHDVRKFACDILGLLDTRQYADYIKPLLKDEDENAVQSAIEALGNYQDESSVELLIEIYDSTPDQKPNVIEALGKIGSQAAIDKLLHALTHETDEFLKTAVIDALSASCEDIDVARKLLSKIEEVSEATQLIVLKTVVAIAFRLGESIELPQHLRYLSYKALFDNDDDVRAAGLLALGDIYTPDDFPSIFNELFNNNPDTQSVVLEKLLMHNSPQIIKRFFKTLCAEVASKEALSCGIDFLSLLDYMWSDAPEDSKAATISALAENMIEIQHSDYREIFELLNKLDMSLTEETVRAIYQTSPDAQKEMITELAAIYQYDLSIASS